MIQLQEYNNDMGRLTIWIPENQVKERTTVIASKECELNEKKTVNIEKYHLQWEIRTFSYVKN